MTDHSGLGRLWLGALAAFILAGVTGSLLRWSPLVGMPAGLRWDNVRHAHSHTMYFAWVTPALMALISVHLSALTGQPISKRMARISLVTLILGFLTFPPFLLYGYAPVTVGNARIPVSNIMASLNILAWYAYIVAYRRATRGVDRSLPLHFWDAALAFMVVASLGAWARAALAAMRVQQPFWTEATVMLFLGTFSDGWFVLALLGIAHALLPRSREAIAAIGRNLMIVGLPVVFLLGVSMQYMPLGLRLIAGIGGMFVAIGTLFNVWALWPATEKHLPWRMAIFFLGVKAVAQWLATSPAVALWAESVGLRIPYLHVLLLGFVTLGVVAAAAMTWWPQTEIGVRWMVGAVWVMIVSLLLLTGLWPAAWGGQWVLTFAALAALAPVVAGVIILVRAARQTG